MNSRTTHLRILQALFVSGVLGVAPSVSASAQRAGEAASLFDPRSGRFSIPGPEARAPDTLDVSADRLWAALPAAYAELGVPLTVVDSASHYLGAIRVTTRRPVSGLRLSAIVECGTGSFGPNAERYTVQLTLLAGVQTLDASHSALAIKVDGSAAPNGLSSTVKCESNGALEDKLASIVRRQIAH
jgi:hypothetical protein